MDSLNEVREQLERQKETLTKLIQHLRDKQKKRVPGVLNITGRKGRHSFYQCHLDRETQPRYLSKIKDRDRINKLAQQDYETELLKEAEKELAAVEKAARMLSLKGMESIYASLCPARKELVKPLFPDRERMIADWESVICPPGRFESKDPEFYTERGERVRSKSEKIIGDKYLRLGIPYRYEYPLSLKVAGGYKIFRPDFSVLNTRTGKTYFHQHLGKMDDPGYVRDNIEKLEIFQENGIFLGEKLFLTFETYDKPFDDRTLDPLIDKYLR